MFSVTVDSQEDSAVKMNSKTCNIFTDV